MDLPFDLASYAILIPAVALFVAGATLWYFEVKNGR